MSDSYETKVYKTIQAVQGKLPVDEFYAMLDESTPKEVYRLTILLCTQLVVNDLMDRGINYKDLSATMAALVPSLVAVSSVIGDKDVISKTLAKFMADGMFNSVRGQNIIADLEDNHGINPWSVNND